MSASPAAPLTEPSVPIRQTVSLDARAGSGEGAHALDGHDALPRRAAMLHARDDLLPDIASLLEVDAIQLIEQRLMREGVAERVVAAAFRHAEADAHGVIVRFLSGLAAKLRRARSAGNEKAKAKLGQPGVGINNGAFGQARGSAPRRSDGERRRRCNFRRLP